MAKKERIDLLLVEKGFFDSREKAKRSIMAGLVKVDDQVIDKPGTKVDVEAKIDVKRELHPFVSRGGLKLLKAIETFHLDLTGKVVMDIGASTGGFTDCALQHGAKEVYAIDVGYGQLAWQLRQDPRVHVMERTNFRYLKKEDLVSSLPNFATIDVSFISLKIIFNHLKTILLPNGEVVALVKPQFEAGKEFVGKNGIIKDPKIHQQVLRNIISFALEAGYDIQGLTYSPIKGGEGNIEFLMYMFYKKSKHIVADYEDIIIKTVQTAHIEL
ncbi:TlyA family RNA methyltransferase [Tepidibacillus sp. LV47]|uniref:TlyA family RNA methyltransferase n=1 Tax=Tepidibacillus sp. LV47 TaxID=3398228 RepID=UPI003AAA4301